MKKHGWIVFAGTFVLGLFMVTANAQAIDKEALKAEIKKEIKEELKAEGGPLAGIEDRIKFSGLIEFGGAWQDVDYTAGHGGGKQDDSDLALTTVELTAEAEVNDWVNVAVTFLYEDATFQEGDEAQVTLDAATLTIGNTEEFPLYLSAGAMYVPFGALLTHFPDDPLVEQPLTLLLGETREKALLVGVEHQAFSVSGYLFNGDMDKTGEDNQIESYGLDANFSFDDEAGFDLLVGASYISNIADSDGLTDALEAAATVKDYVDGFDVYLHVGYAPFFFDAEYMSALDEFEPGELGDKKAQPAVYNLEAGYNLDWGKNLEIALKYAGSSESDQLGFPEQRYGIALNQEIFDGVIASVAYLHDDYENDDVNGNDDRDMVFAQIAIEF